MLPKSLTAERAGTERDWQRGQKWEISIITVKSNDLLALSFQDFSAKPEVVNKYACVRGTKTIEVVALYNMSSTIIY